MSTARSEPATARAAESPTGAQIELRRGPARAVITERGARLRSWCAGGVELLDTFAADAPADSYRGAVLAPWPNRIRDGRYVFGGVVHRLALTEPARGAALHGLVLDAPFAVVDRTDAAVTLACDLGAGGERAGYPFAVRLEVSYELDPDGLTFALRATNRGDAPAPFGGGLHPYVAGRADDWVLDVPAATRVPVDPERLLPIGAPVPVAGTPYDFTRARHVGRQRIDACFGDLARDADGRARIRLSGREREIELRLDERFRFVHVYTGDAVDDPARARGGIAIEPLTCAPDAFNSGAGLEVLEPGATVTARCGLHAAGP